AADSALGKAGRPCRMRDHLHHADGRGRGSSAEVHRRECAGCEESGYLENFVPVGCWHLKSLAIPQGRSLSSSRAIPSSRKNGAKRSLPLRQRQEVLALLPGGASALGAKRLAAAARRLGEADR